jgi:trk system potassium uptake protein TrkH
MFGGFMALPLIVGHLFSDAAERAYDLSIVMTLGVGAFLWVIARRTRVDLEVQHGFLLVALAWTALPAFATLPLLRGIPGLSFTDAG